MTLPHHPLANACLLTALPDLLVDPVVRAALAEDLGRAGDITAAACVPAGVRMAARFCVRKPGRIAGLDCARLAIAALDPTARFAVRRWALAMRRTRRVARRASSPSTRISQPPSQRCRSASRCAIRAAARADS